VSDTILEIKSVSHNFGPTRVLHNLDLEIKAGEIVGVVGPSGCGKSTLLRGIVGTHPPAHGTIRVKGRDGEMKAISKPSRDIGIVYQHYSLFPFQTALKNVMMGPMLDETSIWGRYLMPWIWHGKKGAVRREAVEILERLGLGEALHRYPPQMSGGMQQRTAIAQAIIMKPRILLLDEPFGALDEATRERQQKMLLEFSIENRKAKAEGREPPYTVLIVTHELNEAIYVGDRVIGLSQYWDWQAAGHQQCPGATIVYNKPCPTFDPNDPKDYADFVDQKDEIIDTVFEPDIRKVHEDLAEIGKERAAV
tara:strand:- start:10432 stop:11355 length:924 start_codon:yes stop_codon:yes gene_type:complete